jgi:hypothetical protein
MIKLVHRKRITIYEEETFFLGPKDNTDESSLAQIGKKRDPPFEASRIKTGLNILFWQMVWWFLCVIINWLDYLQSGA